MENNNAQLKTIVCEVVVITKDAKDYTVLVVKTDEGMLPISIPYNYEVVNLRPGDYGVLAYEEAIAGITKWWDKSSEKFYTHNYTVYYFKHFLHTNKKLSDALYIQ